MGKSKVALYDSRLWKDREPHYFFLEKGQRYDLAARRRLP